jgi:hypothetical protein
MEPNKYYASLTHQHACPRCSKYLGPCYKLICDRRDVALCCTCLAWSTDDTEAQ